MKRENTFSDNQAGDAKINFSLSCSKSKKSSLVSSRSSAVSKIESAAVSNSQIFTTFNFEGDSNPEGVDHGVKSSLLLSISAGNRMELEATEADKQLVIPCINRYPKLNIAAQHKPNVASNSQNSSASITNTSRCSSNSQDLNILGQEKCKISIEDHEAAKHILHEIRGVQCSDHSTVQPILPTNSSFSILRKRDANLSDKDIVLKELENLPNISPDAYDKVPVDKFGLAMLLGMGYNKDESSYVKPLELKKRTYHRAGLGAELQMGASINKISRRIAGMMQPTTKNINVTVSASSLADSALATPNNPSEFDVSSTSHDNITTVVKWVRKDLIVKIVDPQHKFYKHKGRVVDISNLKCKIQLLGTDESLIEIPEKNLESVVNERSSDLVIVNKDIVHPISIQPLLGQKVTLHNLSRAENRIVVQLQSDPKVSLNLSLDDVCEFRH